MMFGGNTIDGVASCSNERYLFFYVNRFDCFSFSFLFLIQAIKSFNTNNWILKRKIFLRMKRISLNNSKINFNKRKETRNSIDRFSEKNPTKFRIKLFNHKKKKKQYFI
jgi:hypothetical protein